MTIIDMENALEAMMDEHGTAEVLHRIAEVAVAKAEHLRANWQDPVSANVWDQCGLNIEKAADKTRVLD